MQSQILGIDLGGTNIRIGLIDEGINLHHYEMASTEVLLNHHPVQNLIHFIQDYLNRYTGGAMPDGISIGFPSTISKDRRTLYNTPNIEGLDNLAIGDLLEEAFDTKIFISRDVNLLLHYDMYHFHLPPQGTVIACYFGTGLGNAILLDGKILRGRNGVAAELGHIPIPCNDRVCGCGNRGCAETVVGGRYLEMLQEVYFPKIPLPELFSRAWPHPELENYVNYMAVPVATEINILDPDHIILGGGILQMKDFPYEQLLDRIRTYTRKPYPACDLRFHRSHQEQLNGVIGAGLYGLKKLQVLQDVSAAR